MVQMKERIIDSLKKIALNCDTKNLTSDIKLPKNKISQNAVIAINNLILNYDKFNVRTTDSFINLIIKACALKLGISPDYKILDSYDEYIDYAIDSFLDEVFVSKDVEELLNCFFDQFVVDSNSSWNIKNFISKNFKDFYGKEIPKQKLFLDDGSRYNKVLSILSAEFNKLCAEMSEIKEFNGLHKNLRDAIEKIKKEDNYLFRPARDMSDYFKKEEPHYNQKSPQSEKLNELFYEIKKVMKNFFEYRAFHYYDTYLRIFNYIVDEFDKRSQKDSILFLQDINRKILKIFQSDLLPEIYYRLSNNFKDFLVDEFQDTNNIQWETLKLIVEENLSQNGSFFYVGDKKQAIYGFRGSDFRIFDLPLTEFAGYSPKKFTLTTNYRSCQAIVDFNNSVFCSRNIENLINHIVTVRKIRNVDNYCKELADVFESSGQNVCEDKKNKGYVEISRYEYSTKEDNAVIEDKIKEYLYKTIEDLTKRFSYKDITVLCRENKDVEKIGKWLLEKNINIESFKTLNIVNANIVKELFSILQFLNVPMDNIAFAAFITSDIFLKRTGLDRREVLDFLCENSFESGGNNVLYIKFRKAYTQIWKDYIEEFFKSAGFIAVYELTIAVIARFKVLENFPKQSNVILRFLEVISDFETKQQGLQNFTDYFTDGQINQKNEKFFIKVSSENAVKVMSVHKAKGLQFNVVIMPYFSIGSISADSPFLSEKDGKVSFVRLNKDLTAYSDTLNDIYYKKYFKSLSDELNTLYVATTRAVYEFYGFIIMKAVSKEEERDFMDVFVPKENGILGHKQVYDEIKKEETESSDMEIIATQPDDITDLICDSAVEIYGGKNKDILIKGLTVHYALSLIESFDKESFEEVINNAVKGTMLVYSEQDSEDLRKTLNDLLSKPDIAKFFDKKNRIFNEKEFVDGYGNTVRLDKLVIKENEVDIIDYKTSIYDKEYITKQLQNYRSVIEELYPDTEIKCFVIETEKKLLRNFIA